MTKKPASNSAQGAEVATTESLNVPAIVNGDDINLVEMFENFEAQQTEDLQNLDAVYLQMTENTTYNFIFQRIETTVIDGNEREVVRLVDKAGNAFISGLTVLVNSCKRIENEAPCFVRIVTGTKQSGANGKYLQLNVYKL